MFYFILNVIYGEIIFLSRYFFLVYIGKPHMIIHGRVSYLEFKIVSNRVLDEDLNVKLSHMLVT